MEYASIEREIAIDAPPAVVYEVVSSAEHLREWWPDDAELSPTPGSEGRVTFVRPEGAKVEALTVVEAEPPHRFSFRWVYDDGRAATVENSLLVTFDLVPSGAGTVLHFTETGFREKGWEDAVLAQEYRDHAAGWDYFLPRLVAYASLVGARR
jgi:uncharacterized protein YndB with AHSA1/START domain